MRRRSVRDRATRQAADPPPPTFDSDIRPIFEPFAAAMMWRFDLTNYDAVASNALTIQGRITGPNADMPPPPFPLLATDQVDLFVEWVNNGCPR